MNSSTSSNSAIAAIQSQSAAYVQKAHLLAQGAATIYISSLGWLEIGSVVISAVLIGATVYFIIKTGWLATRVNRMQDVILKADVPKKEIQKSWKTIQEHFFVGGDNDLKVAILDADKLLDEALRGAGIQGANLGDRLKKIKPSQLPDIEALWQAHKLRNQIAHESDFKLKRDLAERTLQIYEKTLHDLKALD
jgi:hypothetical protein